MGRRNNKKRNVRQVETETKECRICLSDENQADIIEPCECKGSVKYVHKECLQKWINIKYIRRCDICKKRYKDTMGLDFKHCLDLDFIEIPDWCIGVLVILLGVLIFLPFIPGNYMNRSKRQIDVIVTGNKGVGKTTLIDNIKKFTDYDMEKYNINYIESHSAIESYPCKFIIHIKRFKSCKKQSHYNNLLIWNFDELPYLEGYKDTYQIIANFKNTTDAFYKTILKHMIRRSCYTQVLSNKFIHISMEYSREDYEKSKYILR